VEEFFSKLLGYGNEKTKTRHNWETGANPLENNSKLTAHSLFYICSIELCAAFFKANKD